MQSENVLLQPGDFSLKLLELTDDTLQCQTRQFWQTIMRLMEGLGRRPHAPKAFGGDDPELCEKRMVGRVTASQIASASAAPIFPRFTYDVT